MNDKIVTILGSGFLNKYLVRLLNKKNYRCIISTRTPFQKGYLKTQATPGAIELIEWNPNNFSELKESIKNSDVVINLIGILYETRKQKFMKIHRDIPEAVAKICAQSDVKKFINISAIGASENSKSLYQRSKFQGEVKALTNFKNTVIIRPSVIEGTESNFSNLFAKLSFFPIIPIVNKSYKFQPILVTDVSDAIVKAIEAKDNHGKIYEIGGPKIISFGDMVKSILRTINKKRFVVEMPMPLAKAQSALMSMLPIPPMLTIDQCKILSEADNIVSNNHLTLEDLNVKPSDVEEAMIKWLVRFRDRGAFSLKKYNEKH
jgi:uncharacterized protein YbjT (DUF2867 family)